MKQYINKNTNQFTIIKKQKARNNQNLHYTRVITRKRVTSGGVSSSQLKPGQHSFAETSQRWRAVDDTVSDQTDPGTKPQTSCTDSNIFELTGRLKTSNKVKPRMFQWAMGVGPQFKKFQMLQGNNRHSFNRR